MAWSAQNEADVLEQLFKVEQDFGAVGTGEAGMHASRNGWSLIEVRDLISGSVTYDTNGTGGPHPTDPSTPILFDETVELSRNARARTGAQLGAAEFNVLDSPSNRYQHILLPSINHGAYPDWVALAPNGDGSVRFKTIGQPDLTTRLRATANMPFLGLPSGAAQAGSGLYALTRYAREGELYVTRVPAVDIEYDYGTTADASALAHARAALDAPIIPPGDVYPTTFIALLPSIARPYDDGVAEVGVQQDGTWALTREWDPVNGLWIDGTPASLILAGTTYSGQYTVAVTRTISVKFTGG